ncbi:MAG: histidine phosphatase family protein [Oscillospiraceae bacterium]
MLKILFIRHGKTYGNTLKRYIGTTDEPLLPESIIELNKKSYPMVDKVYCSPLLRTRQTAEIIYPQCPATVVDGLKECDFGEFENKNYIELEHSEEYSKWVASQGTLPFPNGEETGHFKNRCVSAFRNILEENSQNDITIAIVAHGGTIMAVLEEFALPKKSFYCWQAENGEGYSAVLTANKSLTIIGKI